MPAEGFGHARSRERDRSTARCALHEHCELRVGPSDGGHHLDRGRWPDLDLRRRGNVAHRAGLSLRQPLRTAWSRARPGCCGSGGWSRPPASRHATTGRRGRCPVPSASGRRSTEIRDQPEPGLAEVRLIGGERQRLPAALQPLLDQRGDGWATLVSAGAGPTSITSAARAATACFLMPRTAG